MAARPPPPPPPILNTQISLLRTFSSFLRVAIHTILYTRGLYPATTFITTRAYNFPVHQNRHPAVCQWVNDSVSAVQEVMGKNAARRVVVVIFSAAGEVMERYLFDVSGFPTVEKGWGWVEFEERPDEKKGSEKGKEKEPEGDVETEGDAQGGRRNASADTIAGKTLNMVDIEEQLRGTIRMLDYEASKKSPLPDNCTYTVAVELKDDPDVMPPIGVSFYSRPLQCINRFS